MYASDWTVLDALRDVMSATDHADCVARIETHLERMFAHASPVLTTGDWREDTGSEAVVLEARDRVQGWIEIDRWELIDDAQRAQLQSFAEHAALALDNARLLEDRERQAGRDHLTGLLNRGQFNQYLAHWVAEVHADATKELSLAVFDLDNFKIVNDRSGHVAGDRLLRAAAAALAATCRSSDAAFRIGGDEFALLLPGASHQDATAVAARAADAIAQLEGSNGASWGVSTLPTDATTREGLVTLADAAMYERKGHTGPTVAPRRNDASSRLEVVSRLAVKLTTIHHPEDIAAIVVKELHSAFGYYLAVIHRLDDDGMLRVVGGAGRLAARGANFLAWKLSVDTGVNGRVVRTGRQALVNDTRQDPDYLRVDPELDPGSELCTPIVVDGSVWGTLNLEQLATHGFGEYDVMLAQAIVAQIGSALHRCALVEEMEHSFSTTLAVLCDALEAKDAYTADHAEEVSVLAMATARKLGTPGRLRRGLRYSALLHDIGKIGIRSDLLAKPSALTPEEYREIQEHSAIGAMLLSRIPSLAHIAPLVRGVHERWDGGGYPDGLAGTVIPIESRIVSVCDAWHAMTSDRPYRQAMPRERAMAELSRGSGSQFDPDVVDAFVRVVEREESAR